MTRKLALLCVIAALALGDVKGANLGDPAVLVRYDFNPFAFGNSAFMSMPTTTDAATESKWVQVKGIDGPEGFESLVMWCPSDDYTVCMLYDSCGYIAGLQIALNKANFEQNPYDMSVQGFTEWTTTLNDNTVSYYVTRQYYTSPKTLALDCANRVAPSSNAILQDGSVFLTGFDGKLFEVSTDTSTWDNGPFTQQACFPWMGEHYYYNMTKTTECSASTMFPWFLLKYDDKFVGIGFGIFGKLNVTGKQYNEVPPLAAVQKIVPTAPQCYYDMASNPGVVTMHTYFYSKPRQMTCVNFLDKLGW